MALESLQLEYDIKLKEYNQLFQDYKQYLATKETNVYIHLKDKSFYGLSSLNMSTANSVEECQARCSSNPKCSGATYTPTSQMCDLRTGQGDISSAVGKYAILTATENYTNRISELNNELLHLNKVIRDMSETDDNNIDVFNEKNDNANETLISNYNDLTSQRAYINENIQEYNNVHASMKDTSLKVTQKMMGYRLHLIIIFLIICLFFLVFGKMELNIIMIPFLLALISYLLNMTSISFGIVVVIILYYVYQIPMSD